MSLVDGPCERCGATAEEFTRIVTYELSDETPEAGAAPPEKIWAVACTECGRPRAVIEDTETEEVEHGGE